ncbi:hypothetical protein V8E52_008216 [Russula decolorans]
MNSLDVRTGEGCHTDAKRNGIQNLRKDEIRKSIMKRVGVREKAHFETVPRQAAAGTTILKAAPRMEHPIDWYTTRNRSCRGRRETDGVADLLGPSGWPGLARCRRVKVLACPYRLRPFFNLSALRDRRCLKKRSLWTLRMVCEQDHYIEGLRRKSLIRFINTTYSSKPSALAEASSANHCASMVLRKMSVEDSVDLEATRFPVLLVGRRICNVYDKEGECEGECGGVRGDGHGQAIDAKHSRHKTKETSIVRVREGERGLGSKLAGKKGWRRKVNRDCHPSSPLLPLPFLILPLLWFIVTAHVGEYRDVEGTIIAIPDIAEKGLVDTRSRSRLQGIGILSRLLVEYDAKNLPAHLRALVKTSVHSDRALGKLEAGFITDPFYTIDLMQGSVKSNALPEEAWAVVNHRIATQRDVLKQLAREFNITYTAFGSEISTEDGPTAGTLTLTEAWGTPLEPAPITPFGEDSASGPQHDAVSRRCSLTKPLARVSFRLVLHIHIDNPWAVVTYRSACSSMMATVGGNV